MIKQAVVFVFCLTLLAPVARSEEANPPVFRVAYAAYWHPISEGEGSRVRGILPDIMEAVVKGRMGIAVEHVGLPWGRAQEAVRSGKVDGFITTPTAERLEYAVASQEIVYTLAFRPVVRRGSDEARLLQSEEDVMALWDRRFCDVLGNGWAKVFYAEKGIEPEIVATIEACLRLMVAGRMDAVIHAAPVVESFIEALGYDEVLEVLPVTMESSPGFPLLLSKKSRFGEEFLTRFDEAMRAYRQERNSKNESALWLLPTPY